MRKLWHRLFGHYGDAWVQSWVGDTVKFTCKCGLEQPYTVTTFGSTKTYVFDAERDLVDVANA